MTVTEKANKMRAVIAEAAESFRQEGKIALADSTVAPMKDADDETLARLHDIIDRGLSKEEAIEAINAGEA
ncbi:hypothetical protein vBCbaSRXM_69 [Citromicrobium phage vB_CbaS-RXM]|nr:hypothetical protein vBCbaSRXM_69 [Citromicrobium phage vB_CbaS-RXM]